MVVSFENAFLFLFIHFSSFITRLVLFVNLNACKRLKSGKSEVFFVRWSEFGESTRDTYSCFYSAAHFITGDSSTHQLINSSLISGINLRLIIFGHSFALYLTHLMHRNRKKRRTKRVCGPNLCGAFPSMIPSQIVRSNCLSFGHPIGVAGTKFCGLNLFSAQFFQFILQFHSHFVRISFFRSSCL